MIIAKHCLACLLYLTHTKRKKRDHRGAMWAFWRVHLSSTPASFHRLQNDGGEMNKRRAFSQTSLLRLTTGKACVKKLKKNERRILFGFFGFRVLLLFSSLGHPKGTEPSLRLSVAPLLLPLRQVNVSAVEKADFPHPSHEPSRLFPISRVRQCAVHRSVCLVLPVLFFSLLKSLSSVLVSLPDSRFHVFAWFWPASCQLTAWTLY